MSTAAVPHHRIDGPADAPPLLLGSSLGTSLSTWNMVVPVLARSRRVVRWDLPGHGGSPADVLPYTGPGATGMADLAGLVLALADQLGADRFDYAGISLGGAVGGHLAVHHPDRIASLAFVCGAARFAADWPARAAAVRREGTAPLAEAARRRWFTPAFATDPAADAAIRDLLATDPAGYAACCDALAGHDLRADLHRITAPTLVVAGRADPAAPPADAALLATGIPGAHLVEVDSAHLAVVECPAPVRAALLEHLTRSRP